MLEAGLPKSPAETGPSVAAGRTRRYVSLAAYSCRDSLRFERHRSHCVPGTIAITSSGVSEPKPLATLIRGSLVNASRAMRLGQDQFWIGSIIAPLQP